MTTRTKSARVAPVLPHYITRECSSEGIIAVTSCMSKEDLDDFRAFAPPGSRVATHFVNLPGIKREVIDTHSQEIVAVLGLVTTPGVAGATPWLLQREDVNLKTKTFATFYSGLLKSILGQGYPFLIIPKNAEDFEGIKFIERLGFKVTRDDCYVEGKPEGLTFLVLYPEGASHGP